MLRNSNMYPYVFKNNLARVKFYTFRYNIGHNNDSILQWITNQGTRRSGTLFCEWMSLHIVISPICPIAEYPSHRRRDRGQGEVRHPSGPHRVPWSQRIQDTKLRQAGPWLHVICEENEGVVAGSLCSWGRGWTWGRGRRLACVA